VRRTYLLILTFVCFVFFSSHASAQPLIEAARKGDIDTIKGLLDNGADVNEKNNYEATALMFAAVNGHIDAVRLFIEKGADVNIAREGLEALPITKRVLKC